MIRRAGPSPKGTIQYDLNSARIIDILKQMLSQLLKDKNKLRAKIPFKNFKGKRKKGESSSSVNTESEEHSNFDHPNLLLKIMITQRTGAVIPRE